MENTISNNAFNFNPIMCNLSIVKIPSEMDIPDICIKGFEVDINVLSIIIYETEEKNIRDTFRDINKTNSIIRGKNIQIEYLNRKGEPIRKEKYINIEYIGESYGGVDYTSNDTPLITTLKFLFDKRENATTD